MKAAAIATLLALVLFATPSSGQTFNGYPCTIDCSGHNAGYEWAERKGIENPDDCVGNSNSFIEGCRAWAEEQQEESRSDRDDEADQAE